MNVDSARSAVMASLSRCPVCGAAMQEAEKSETLEIVVFECEAALYLQAGGTIAVSRICVSPSLLAVRHLEEQAVAMATQEAI